MVSEKKKKIMKKIEIPEGVNIEVSGKNVTTKGEKGELTRALLMNPKIVVSIENNEVVLKSENPSKRERKTAGTIIAHIKNMIKGVTKGHHYELKICSEHFPMNVVVSGDEFVINNFIGGKIPRKLKINEKSSIKVEGNIISVESIDKEIAGQTAADIEQLTRRPGFDKRRFQDGIYITNKDGKEIK